MPCLLREKTIGSPEVNNEKVIINGPGKGNREVFGKVEMK